MMKRVLKIAATVIVLVVFFCLALVIGDGEGSATAIGWLPFLISVLILLLDRIYVGIAVRVVKFEITGAAHDCQRGMKVPLEITFTNRSFLIIQDLQASFCLADASGNLIREVQAVLSLGPFAQRVVTLPMTFNHLGVFQMGLEKVQVGDVIGLFKKQRQGFPWSEVRVEPKLVNVGGVGLHEETLLESVKAQKSVIADSLDYAYVREYVWGDPLKSIHWKLSARAGTYLTRLYEMNTNPGVTIVLDLSVPEKLELEESLVLRDAVVEAGIAIMHWASAQAMDTELRYIGASGSVKKHDHFEETTGRTIVQNLSRDLQEASEKDTIEILSNLKTESSGHSNIVVCTAQITQGVASAILSTRMHQRYPLVVAVVPVRLVDRDLERYCKDFAALSVAGIAVERLSDSSELAERRLG